MSQEKILKGFKDEERRVLTPPTSNKEISTFRCQGCGRLNTSSSISMFGKCWFCGGHRMIGGSPGPLEWLVLKVFLDVVLFKLLKKWRDWRDDRAWKGGV